MFLILIERFRNNKKLPFSFWGGHGIIFVDNYAT